VVDNSDLADMIGVHSDNIRRTAWILSSVFGALVGILISPSQGLNVPQLILVVIFAFAPAVLGFIYGLPAAYIGGIVLGVVGSILSKYSSSGTVANLEAGLPYLAFFALLVVFGPRLKEMGASNRPLSIARASSGAGAGRRAARMVLGLGRRRVAVDRRLALALAAFGAALFAPLAFHGVALFLITGGFIYALIALTLVVLTGWAGQVSLCQFAFVGVGAFTAGHLAGSQGQHFLFATLVAMAFTVPLALLVGWAALRLSGLYLGLGTLAFALIMDNIVFERGDVSGGITGITVPRPEIFGISFHGRPALYELALVLFGVLAVATYLLHKGPIGRRLQILRDSPVAASTLGVNLTVTKLVVFTICGMVAALGGALYGAWQQAITPFDFMWSASLMLLLLVVLGGRARISGAVLAGSAFSTLLIPGIPPNVTTILNLTIATGVIGIAQEPEGTVAMTKRQTLHVLAVMRPLPRRSREGLRLGARGAGSVVPADTGRFAVRTAVGAGEGSNGHGS
jgi:branched-chain amino acid transport system permease protein